MANLAKNLILGLAAGVAAGVVLSVVEDNPKLPSGLIALGQKLAPLAQAVLADLLPPEQPVAAGEQPEVATATSEQAAPSDAPAASQGHPSGAGFAPTPS